VSQEVVVIGGGIVGVATAYELARRGASVRLLEANELAYGATGRNLGFVWLHTRRAGVEVDLVMDTRRRLDDLDDELGVDAGVLGLDGGVMFFSDERQRAVFAEFVERRNADGVAMDLLDGLQARELVPLLPETVAGATFCPLDAHIDSRRYVRAFALAAQRHGAVVSEGIAARRVLVEHGRATGVETDLGKIPARTVVLAAGGWSKYLTAGLGFDVPIGHMRLQVMQTEPMAPRLRHVLYGAVAAKQYQIIRELPSYREEDFRNDAETEHGLALLESACQKADGSYVLGLTMDYPGFDWRPDLQGVALISRVLSADLPALRDAKFARAWAGVLPFTSDNLPIIDQAPGIDGLIIATGHVFGNGAGPTTGRLVASMVCGEEPVIDLAHFAFERPSLVPIDRASVW
jgi:glycine/D-amino acid oxidase-like deaminating enzyme